MNIHHIEMLNAQLPRKVEGLSGYVQMIKRNMKVIARNLFVSYHLMLKTLVTLNGDVLNQSVHLLLGILILIATSGHPYTDSGGDVSYTISPKSLVEVRVDPNITGLHHRGDEGNDLLDSTRGSLFEGLLEGHLGYMDGVVTGDRLKTLLLCSPFASHSHRIDSYPDERKFPKT